MTEPDFMECAICAAAPGMPPLCRSCLHNRTAIEVWRKRAEPLPTRVRRSIHRVLWRWAYRALA